MFEDVGEAIHFAHESRHHPRAAMGAGVIPAVPTNSNLSVGALTVTQPGQFGNDVPGYGVEPVDNGRPPGEGNDGDTGALGTAPTGAPVVGGAGGAGGATGGVGA